MANLKGEYKEFLDSFDSTNNAVFEFHGIIEEQYKSFSNFVLSSFELDNKTWSSVNHYFQAAKFFGTDDDWSEEIRNAETPFEASRMGKSRSHPIQSNWNELRLSFMKKAVEAKFQQNEDLKKLLLSTGSMNIHCHNPGDGYWGDGIGCGGEHENNLGKLLISTREILN